MRVKTNRELYTGWVGKQVVVHIGQNEMHGTLVNVYETHFELQHEGSNGVESFGWSRVHVIRLETSDD